MTLHADRPRVLWQIRIDPTAPEPHEDGLGRSLHAEPPNLALLLGEATAPKPQPVPLIIDTDAGFDVDDVSFVPHLTAGCAPVTP